MRSQNCPSPHCPIIQEPFCEATKLSLNASDGVLTCADQPPPPASRQSGLRREVQGPCQKEKPGVLWGSNVIFDVGREATLRDGVIREWNPGSVASVAYWPYNAGEVLYWLADRPTSALLMTLSGLLLSVSLAQQPQLL